MKIQDLAAAETETPGESTPRGIHPPGVFSFHGRGEHDQPPAKQVSQGAIGVWLSLSGHVIQQPNRSIPRQLSNPTSKFRMRLNSRLHDG